MSRLAETLDRVRIAWREVAGAPESGLLRLTLLREVTRALHADKSVCLARGDRETARVYGIRERRLEQLRQAGTLPEDFDAALDPDASPLKARTRLVPEELRAALGAEKLERYDRAWELALAAEAARLGWRFWGLEVAVRIPEIEPFHRGLEQRLHPHGIVLWAEGAHERPAVAAETWRGRWIVAVEARYLAPDFRVHEAPGLDSTSGAPEWKLLFAPKAR